LLKIFNYIPQLLYLGCQRKELPTDKDCEGYHEIHYTRIYRALGRWLRGCHLAGSVLNMHEDKRLDITVSHGGGTTMAATKSGDAIGFNGHKVVKGDEVVGFCGRNCKVSVPFVSASGNRNEAPPLREALPELMRIVRDVGMALEGIASLDGVYDWRVNRKAISNAA
jgi:hypothetical protein